MQIQDVEIAKLHDRIIGDVTRLISKYQKIMDWDVLPIACGAYIRNTLDAPR